MSHHVRGTSSASPVDKKKQKISADALYNMMAAACLKNDMDMVEVLAKACFSPVVFSPTTQAVSDAAVAAIDAACDGANGSACSGEPADEFWASRLKDLG